MKITVFRNSLYAALFAAVCVMSSVRAGGEAVSRKKDVSPPGDLIPKQGLDVPLVMPDPDGKPGNPKKPVKVYILAGQSNMLGFGYISGSRPSYTSIFLTADPNVIPRDLSVWGSPGRHAVVKLTVFQEASGDAQGGKAALYKGAYDAEADYTKLKPAEEKAVDLGAVTQMLPSMDEPHTVVAKTFVEVPVNGTYRVHVGHGDSRYAVATLEGKEVYRRVKGSQAVLTDVELETGKRYPVTIAYMKGGSAAFWMEQIGLQGRGDLETVVKKEGTFPWMVDDKGNWTVRKDVTYAEARVNPDGKWEDLTATSNGKFIGPEVAFGFVMGQAHDEQVLLIESSMGNRALTFDFRPPSSGYGEPRNEWEGKEWDLMITGVKTVLGKIDQVIPGYQGQGYEIAGFVWWQGHKDAGKSKEEYEACLVNLIKDLRKEFNVPEMKAAVATVAFHGWNLPEKWHGVHAAQMAVGDAGQHPEFAGNVASVDARGYWRPANESPTATDYHYNHNAETYMLVGDALGRAMASMMEDVKVECPPAPKEPAMDDKAQTELTEAQKEAGKSALEPLVVDGMIASYVSNPNTLANLHALADGRKPARISQFLRDGIDSLVNYYRAIEITDYNWHDFGPDMKNGEWYYFSSDAGEEYPAWFAKDFDAKKAGWKVGMAPFGQRGGEMVALGGCADDSECRCGVVPKTLWEKHVIRIRQTFKIPPLKEGHRYRILVGGSNHINAGTGYKIYADGKLLAESGAGVAKRQGGQPRGGHIYADLKPEFADGEVTIAVQTSLRTTHPRIKPYPPSGHLSVWVQEQKIPTLPEMEVSPE